MSSDSNPVKRFRSLSGSQGESDVPDSSKKQDEQESIPSTRLTPPLSSYSAPGNHLSENAAVPAARQQSDPPGPPPWGKVSAVKQQGEDYELQMPRRAPAGSGPYVPQNGPSPDTAYVIELIGGLFGFFGLGFMYAGQTGSGTTRLIIGILCNLVVGFFAAITAGIAACLVLPIYIVVAILSAASVKKLLIHRYQQIQ